MEYFEEASLNEKDGDWKGEFSGKGGTKGTKIRYYENGQIKEYFNEEPRGSWMQAW